MSRWREMMMDYGEIFGSDKGMQGAGSDVFSIDSDIKDKRKSDLQLRRTLEVHFRPLFQRFVYGGEKIACHDLRRILRDPEYRVRLPPDKIQELADVADFNRGKAITYTEFVNIVMNELPQEDLASMGDINDMDTMSKGSLGGGVCLSSVVVNACRNTTAQQMVEDRSLGYRCLPPPIFMILITAAQILVYVIMNSENDVTSEALDGIPRGNVLMYLPNRRREVWRWFSYCLLHQGFVDLIFNIVLQLCVGIPLEIMFSWRVAVVYITGVIVGSCAHSVSDHNASLVGAAGGSYALVASNLVTIIYNLKGFNNDFSESRLKRIVCSVTLRFILVLLIVIPQVCLAIYRRWFMDGAVYNIGIAAHIGGILAGAMMSDAFLQDVTRSPLKGWAALFCLFSFLFLAGFTVIFNIAWPDYPVEDYS